MPVEEAEHQELHGPALSFEDTEEPGRYHPALIDHETIPCPKPAGQIREARVDPRPTRPINHEQPRGVPRLHSLLRNAIRR